MRKIKLMALLLATLMIVSAFAGCAGVKKEELDALDVRVQALEDLLNGQQKDLEEIKKAVAEGTDNSDILAAIDDIKKDLEDKIGDVDDRIEAEVGKETTTGVSDETKAAQQKALALIEVRRAEFNKVADEYSADDYTKISEALGTATGAVNAATTTSAVDAAMAALNAEIGKYMTYAMKAYDYYNQLLGGVNADAADLVAEARAFLKEVKAVFEGKVEFTGTIDMGDSMKEVKIDAYREELLYLVEEGNSDAKDDYIDMYNAINTLCDLYVSTSTSKADVERVYIINEKNKIDYVELCSVAAYTRWAANLVNRIDEAVGEELIYLSEGYDKIDDLYAEYEAYVEAAGTLGGEKLTALITNAAKIVAAEEQYKNLEEAVETFFKATKLGGMDKADVFYYYDRLLATNTEKLLEADIAKDANFASSKARKAVWIADEYEKVEEILADWVSEFELSEKNKVAIIKSIKGANYYTGASVKYTGESYISNKLTNDLLVAACNTFKDDIAAKILDINGIASVGVPMVLAFDEVEDLFEDLLVLQEADKKAEYPANIDIKIAYNAIGNANVAVILRESGVFTDCVDDRIAVALRTGVRGLVERHLIDLYTFEPDVYQLESDKDMQNLYFGYVNPTDTLFVDNRAEGEIFHFFAVQYPHLRDAAKQINDQIETLDKAVKNFTLSSNQAFIELAGEYKKLEGAEYFKSAETEEIYTALDNVYVLVEKLYKDTVENAALNEKSPLEKYMNTLIDKDTLLISPKLTIKAFLYEYPEFEDILDLDVFEAAKKTMDDRMVELFAKADQLVDEVDAIEYVRGSLADYTNDENGDGVHTNKAETFIDANNNGVWDAAEPFTDANLDGVWSSADTFTDLNGNGVWDDAEELTVDLNGNGEYDAPETLTIDHDGDGKFDFAEEYVDVDGNGVYDADAEAFVDANSNGVWDAAEIFQDLNNDGVWNDAILGTDGTPAEPWVDTNMNGVWDDEEAYDDANGNGVWDAAEELTVDLNNNGVWDAAEAFVDSRLWDEDFVNQKTGVINGDHNGDGDTNEFNGNGIWDPAEELTVDHNGNGKYDPAETWTEVIINGKWDAGESYDDLNGNGKYDEGEPFSDKNEVGYTDGKYDAPEPFDDVDGNLVWTDADQWLEENGDMVWNDAEELTDTNGDGIWTGADEFTDLNGNGVWDAAEDLTDTNGNGVWDAAEVFDDKNGNGVWDAATLGTAGTPAEPLIDTNFDGRWNAAEGLTDTNGDGIWTGADTFTDTNGNGVWDDTDEFTDLNGNGVWDEGDQFNDKNGNGIFEPVAEPYVDVDRSGSYSNVDEAYVDVNGNGKWDAAEYLEDLNGDGKWNPADTFVDRNGNGKMDAAMTPVIYEDKNDNGKYDAGEEDGVDQINITTDYLVSLNDKADIDVAFATYTDWSKKGGALNQTIFANYVDEDDIVVDDVFYMEPLKNPRAVEYAVDTVIDLRYQIETLTDIAQNFIVTVANVKAVDGANAIKVSTNSDANTLVGSGKKDKYAWISYTASTHDDAKDNDGSYKFVMKNGWEIATKNTQSHGTWGQWEANLNSWGVATKAELLKKAVAYYDAFYTQHVEYIPDADNDYEAGEEVYYQRTDYVAYAPFDTAVTEYAKYDILSVKGYLFGLNYTGVDAAVVDAFKVNISNAATLVEVENHLYTYLAYDRFGDVNPIDVDALDPYAIYEFERLESLN